MKATQLRGMSVVSIAIAEKLGEVQDLVLNPDAQHMVGICGSNWSPRGW